MAESLPTALPQDVRDEAEATGLRLAACVRHTLQVVIGNNPTAHTVSKDIALDGVIAKRIVRMTRQGITGAEAVTRAPSAENLRVFADRCAKSLSPLDLDALRDAIGRFESLIRRAGASKGELTSLLRTPQQPAGPSSQPRLLLRRETDNTIRALDDADTDANPWAHWSGLNILASDADLDALLALSSPRVMCFSGTPANDLFERSSDAWLPRAFEQLCDICAKLAPQLSARNRTLLLRPHARHVLSDVARCASFLRDVVRPMHWPVALALDPLAMLEDDMQVSAIFHITRTFETLGPMCSCVLLPLPRGEGGSRRSRETGEGSLSMVIQSLIDRFVPPHIPLIFDAV